MQWRCNQWVWVRLLIHGEARRQCEIVKMYGEPESMTGQELYSVLCDGTRVLVAEVEGVGEHASFVVSQGRWPTASA